MALLEQIIAIHPDAILFLLLGVVEFQDERLPEHERYTRAEKAFLKAAEARSLVPVRHSAEFCVMATRWMSADVPPKNQAMLDKAAEVMRRFVDSGTVRPYMAELVTHIACIAGDWDRARWLLHQWPNEPVAQRYRPRILYETHSYDLAVQAEDKVLERD